jgi:hypothetical protein
MSTSNHPFSFLSAKLLDQKPELVLEFSKYVHLGRGKTLSREILQAEARHIDSHWVHLQFLTLLKGQELALHSRIYDNDKIYHIPMIDFINTTSEEEALEKVRHISKILRSDIYLFKSGNSLHGYYFCLIDENQWHKYLGSLLLCNPPPNAGEEIIDSRWIGHSLEHGFSALRWSHNTEIYQSIPQRAIQI